MGKLYVISGAGISVESGIRAFRTDTDSGKAMWDEYDLEEVCNIHSFNSGFYHKTHSFYNKRREELETVEPNLAHTRIAEWYKNFPDKVVNITTNVDDLFERAGVNNEDVIHVHGYLKKIRYILNKGDEEQCVDIGYKSIDPDEFHWCKPDVVFFGELAPIYGQMYEAFDSINKEDLILLVGCSNQVINFMWELLPAVIRGASMIVINPQISMSDKYQMEGKNIEFFVGTAVEAFSNKEIIEKVESVLQLK